MMRTLKVGGIYAADQLGLKDRGHDLRTASVEIRGDCMVIADDVREPEGHFCVQQRLDVARQPRVLQVDAHFDWRLPARTNVEPFPGVRLKVFRQHDKAHTFLGEGHVCMVGSGGENAQMQVDLTQLNRTLADELTCCQESPIDGAELRTRLEQKACNRMGLAKRLATSWLGKLPRSNDPISTRRKRPEEIKAWHRLWAQLKHFHQFPWCCWPATWDEPDEQGVSYFQDEWQNGGTFGYRKDGIWIHKWACKSEMTLAARDAAEFAIQFVIYGLVQGADGRFVSTKECPKWVQPLPITPWADFLCDEYTFVGSDGAIGISTGWNTTLAMTRNRFEELLREMS
ncbi:MAG: hypothetical protein AB7K24_31365 [Gemmataceae bacterium]